MIVSVSSAGKVDVMPNTEGPGEASFVTCVAARVSAWTFPKPYPKDGDDSFIMGLDFAP